MERDIKLTKLNEKEVLRYMGYKGMASDSIDDTVNALMTECEQMILETARPRYTYKVFKFDIREDGVLFHNTNLFLPGSSIVNHLKGCELAVCMAVTISEGVDRQIRILQLSDMAKACVYDCMASTAVEQVCDMVEKLIKEEYPDYYQTFRFGIGYGDLPLEKQPDFLKVVDAPKKIGLNVGSSNMMVPTKSVTAIIGLSKNPVDNKNRGCATCKLNGTCRFRQEGGHCSG